MKLGRAEKLFIQQVTSTFLYYARVVDDITIVASSVIASDQAVPMENIIKKAKICLD